MGVAGGIVIVICEIGFLYVTQAMLRFLHKFLCAFPPHLPPT